MLFKHKKKYTLVLGGGGANGAYQIGAWKAFRELGINFEAIIGNSVGALNAGIIAMNNFKTALDLWENITLDQIVKIPKELLKDGKLNINLSNINTIKEIQKIFIHEKGLDTQPLKLLIKKYINENTLRASKIDIGIVTYQLNNFKPVNIFLSDIENGLLDEYLVASASIPFLFRSINLKGKQFIDGGVYDNVPFNIAKYRGYKDIIVVDVSGLGVSRKPNIEGTNTIYIKNSIDLGNIIDFSGENSKKYINLGYLDTLKIFNKLDGVKFFYKIDNKIDNKLNKLIFDQDLYKEYSKYIKLKNDNFNIKLLNKLIKEILPKPYNLHKNIIISLLECAALTLNLKRNYLYNFKDIIKIIWNKYNDIEKKSTIFSDKTKNIFDIISDNIKQLNFKNDIKSFFKKTSLEHEKDLQLIFGKSSVDLHYKAISNFFPNLLGAKIFFILLKKYFNY